MAKLSKMSVKAHSIIAEHNHASDIKKLSINSYGVHYDCNTRNIHYGIKNWSFNYFCVKCSKQIEKSDIKTI